MKIKFLQNLLPLAKSLPRPLYVVGGAVRNYLISGFISNDVDLSGDIPSEILINAIKPPFRFVCEYKNTGTVMFTDGVRKYEYTRFRTDFYRDGGKHKPETVEFTSDIRLDALRRDFKCNAVYYDIIKDEFIDPLGGIEDIENKVLSTVDSPEKVFSHDGLRIMRLARFCGELSFTPLTSVISSAREYVDNIDDVSGERIYSELKAVFNADKKYPFSGKDGVKNAVQVLLDTCALSRIFGVKDFFFDTGLLINADSEIMLPLLLCGLPENQTEKVLTLLKADGNTKKLIAYLTERKDFALFGLTEEEKRIFIFLNAKYIDRLLSFYRAIYRKNDKIMKEVDEFTKVYKIMKKDGTPFSIKDLAIKSADLQKIGYFFSKIKWEQNRLIRMCVIQPKLNNYADLRAIAEKDRLNLD